MFRQMLDEPDGPFAAQILEKVPRRPAPARG